MNLLLLLLLRLKSFYNNELCHFLLITLHKNKEILGKLKTR